jgi:SAM-dependent methyltransferase
VERSFECEICGSQEISGVLERGDGAEILLCRNCGIGKLKNIPENLKEIYSAVYFNCDNDNPPAYVNYESTAAHATLWVKRFIQSILEKGKILDIGCANGYFLGSLDNDYDRYGIEISEYAFQKAEANGIKMIGYDILDSAVERDYAGEFDIVTALATFEHLVEFRRAFDISLKLLKPNGFLLFEIPILSTSINSNGWLVSSYEHIWYPSESSINILLKSFKNCFSFGQESEAKGFPPSYIGLVTKSSKIKDQLECVFKMMVKPTLDGLNDEAILLNLSYHLFHSFSPTPERILHLSQLLEKEPNPLLFKQVSNFWHADAIKASNATYWEQQAKDWKNAYDNLLKTQNDEWWKQQAENWKNAYDNLLKTQNDEWWKQQAENWKNAYDNLLKSLNKSEEEQAEPKPKPREEVGG